MLEVLSNKIDQLNEKIGKAVAFLTILMVLITFIIAIMRYVFSIGFIFIQESVLYLHGINFLLCSAYALKEGYHVKIDIVYNRLSKKKSFFLNIFGILFLLFPTVIFTFIISFPYVFNSWKYLEGSKEAGGLDLVFILKTNLLIMPILLFLQGVSELIKNYLQLKNK